ncbi:MAG: hypothetical protein A2W99_07065 [Bacteroidetes bacterium GWF2_33_16]|nr:MAG: hypothetical protein A2X00_11845 [Bacteroidetes bacterium GWE2_32_14]OFY03154.1 MAG: hypothetical protein A2W99_07065 [Bacteroidetes bacterium GWF2_33_16]
MTDLFGIIQLENSIITRWIREIEFWIFLGLIFLISIKIERTKFLLWSEIKRKWYFYLLSVISVFAATVVIAVSVPIILKILQIPLKQEVLESVADYYCSDKLLLIFGCLTAGIVEEFIFRGYLMPRLEILFKHGWVVIVLSAILFGIGHIGNLSLAGVIVPTLIGLIFSFHYYKYRNIISLMIAHFLIDFASFITSC